ncbi:RAD51-associated protein 1 [Tyto alba]|uniref:RAD51-associated protein 1 n=1 Tax=Tyto alba TaxID=56313 RepID=A0A093GV44_TYTAL|nr:RAD51-associated protein 1 [Tyto alba]
MDDDIPRDEGRQWTVGLKVPAHQKKLLTVDTDDREHTTEAEPKSVPMSPVVSPSQIMEQKAEPTQKTSSSSEPVGRPLHTSSPITDKKPKWIPPAALGSSNNSMKYVSVKSPTQCLRLGLSRLARVKPLHPSATSS